MNCHRPKLQASVSLRQWPCTLASLLIVLPIEMFAWACLANRCAEPSVRRSFSREVIVVTVLGSIQVVSIQGAA
jgi:hypothetical protein